VLCVIVVTGQGRPQESEYEDTSDAAEDTATTTDGLTFVPILNQTSSTTFVMPPFCPQCLYDFKGNRVNKGCPSEKPPKCDKGTLVKTSVGDDFEMCCCNFSNFM
jgi:predicted Zn-ribbon and HTH transcriptional regulator